MSDQKTKGGPLSKILNAELSGPKKVKAQEVLWFLRQFVSLYRAGIPLATTMKLLEEQCSSSAMKASIQKLRADIQSGQMLSEAMENQPKIFHPVVRGAALGGEKGGVLEETLEKAIDWITHDIETRKGIQKALFYPSIIVVGFVIALLVIITVVVPEFKPVFNRLGAELPPATRFVITLEEGITQHGINILLALGALVFAYKSFLTREQRLELGQVILWKIPKIRNLVQARTVVQFSSSLGLLLKAGLPVVKAVDVSRALVPKGPVHKDLDRLRAGILSGDRISEGLVRCSTFPSTFKELVAIGETSGELDSLLAEVARHYRDELRERIHQIIRLIEPCLSAALALVVLGLALAIFSPYWELMQALPT